MSVIRRDDNLETVRARRALTAPAAARLFATPKPTSADVCRKCRPHPEVWHLCIVWTAKQDRRNGDMQP